MTGLPKRRYSRAPLDFEKKTRDTYILAHVNSVRTIGILKLKICISELILGSHEYIRTYVTILCMI
jgi:hypothetical protein